MSWGIFSEHIESHTKPYVCRVANCGRGFTRMSNLNRHRETQHLQEHHLHTNDVLAEGGVHRNIRGYQTRDELIDLLQSIGFICS